MSQCGVDVWPHLLTRARAFRFSSVKEREETEKRKQKKKERKQKEKKQSKPKGWQRGASSSLSTLHRSSVPEPNRKETGSSKGKQRASTATQHVPEDIEMESSSSDSGDGMPSVNTRRPRRARQLPARFRAHSDTDSESDDGIVCGLCNAREPRDCRASIVFLVGLQ